MSKFSLMKIKLLDSINMQYVTIVLLLFAYLPCKSQFTISSIVVSQSKLPIPYMNIGVSGSSLGTVSDFNGKFTLTIPNENLKDTIVFSAIGYTNQRVAIKALIGDSLFFKNSIEELKEVQIRPDEVKYKTIGNSNINSKRMVNFAISNKPNQNLGSEIGKKFSVSKKVWLEKIEFYLAKCSFDTALLRVNIRELKNGIPDQTINTKNLIIEVTKTNGEWKTLDLSKELIQIQGKFVIGIEWIGHSKNGSILSLPISVPSIGSTHFYKYASISNWKKYSQLSTAIRVTYSYLD